MSMMIRDLNLLLPLFMTLMIKLKITNFYALFFNSEIFEGFTLHLITSTLICQYLVSQVKYFGFIYVCRTVNGSSKSNESIKISKNFSDFFWFKFYDHAWYVNCVNLIVIVGDALYYLMWLILMDYFAMFWWVLTFLRFLL